MVELGFIGLGTMGKPMAANLIKAGHTITVYDSRQAAMDQLVEQGAVAVGSPSEVAGRADVVVTMLPDSPDVRLVCVGEDGILEGARAGSTIIDMSTISPSTAQEMAERAQAKAVDFLDAPVSGGESGAIAGALSIMVGGRREAYDRCLPILQVIGKSITYMGESGTGQTTKLCNQTIASLNLLAMCEGLALGAKAGLDMEKLLSVVSAGAAGSWMLSNLGPQILARDLEPGFKVCLMQKDLRLALARAEELKLPLPGLSLVHQLYRSVQAAGMGEKGMQALVAAVEKLSGSRVS